MKKFKTIDVYVNIALILAFTIISLIRLDNTFITGYFVVGGWQLISMIVHVFNKCFTIRGGSRYYYHFTVLFILGFSAFGLVVPPLLIILFPLLIAAPGMAAFYTWLCYDEVYVKMQRPLAVLK